MGYKPYFYQITYKYNTVYYQGIKTFSFIVPFYNIYQLVKIDCCCA